MKISHRVILFLSLFAFVAGTLQAQLAGQIPLNPKNVPQFVDPMPHFAGARINARDGGAITVTAKPNVQSPLSTGTILATGTVGVTPGVGQTKVWAYEMTRVTAQGTATYPANWPGFTVEAQVGVPLTMNYVNGLGGETYANVGLIVDQTLHWASPGGMPADPMTPYMGAPPIVVHLHGGEVPSAFDGGPDSWFMADAAGGQKGSGYVTNVFTYPNLQEEATIWFHDHALGATRLNVYAGMAAFYLLRGPNEEAAKLPGWLGDNLVAERNLLGALTGRQYRPEIEIAIQDRMFDDQGQLYFPANLLAPNPTIHPYWVPEFVGDIITVNGKTWPYQSVEPRRYRFRVLNGSNARFYELALLDAIAGTPGPAIWQIGTDGGLLDRPVKIDPALGQKLVLAPGERADIIIDFTGLANQSFIVRNSGRAPYPKGAPVNGSTTGRIMKFVVGPTLSAPDLSYDPATLAPLRPALFKLANFATGLPAPGITVAKTRQLTLNEVMGPLGPAEILVNNTKWDGRHSPNGQSADDGTGFRSEMPAEGTTEVWKIINLTADAHPIHLHLVQFQLLTRQAFNMSRYVKAYNAAFPAVPNWHDPMMGMMMNFPGGVYVPGYGPPLAYGSTAPAGYLGGNPDVTAFLQGAARPALPNENGWKDTFIMYPGEVTTVIVRFAPQDGAKTAFDFDPSKGPGYVWHCHIVDHEDNEMMRPYGVLAAAGAVRTVASPDITGYPAPHVMAMGGAADGPVEPLASTADLPQSFSLGQNYPNPFNPSTEINFALPLDSHVRMTLYNSLGQQVQTLIDAAAPAGYHTVKVDATTLASGTYFYRLEAGSFVATKKMVLMK